MYVHIYVYMMKSRLERHCLPYYQTTHGWQGGSSWLHCRLRLLRVGHAIGHDDLTIDRHAFLWAPSASRHRPPAYFRISLRKASKASWLSLFSLL